MLLLKQLHRVHQYMNIANHKSQSLGVWVAFNPKKTGDEMKSITNSYIKHYLPGVNLASFVFLCA